MGKEVMEVEQHFLKGDIEIKHSALCRLYAEPDCLVIDELAGVLLAKHKIVRTFKIPFTRLKSIALKREFTKIKAAKSVVGRSMAGAAIAGETGAVVGAISAAGHKTKTQRRYYLQIDYTSANGKACSAVFTPRAFITKPRKFAKYITKTYLLPLQPPQDSGPHIL